MRLKMTRGCSRDPNSLKRHGRGQQADGVIVPGGPRLYEYAVEDAFGVEGTPPAVLVDAEGRIASEMAVGAQEVFKLARVG